MTSTWARQENTYTDTTRFHPVTPRSLRSPARGQFQERAHVLARLVGWPFLRRRGCPKPDSKKSTYTRNGWRGDLASRAQKQAHAKFLSKVDDAQALPLGVASMPTPIPDMVSRRGPASHGDDGSDGRRVESNQQHRNELRTPGVVSRCEQTNNHKAREAIQRTTDLTSIAETTGHE